MLKAEEMSWKVEDKET